MTKMGFALWAVALVAAFAAGQLEFTGSDTEDRPNRSFEEIIGERDHLDRSNELSRFFININEADIGEIAEIVEARQYWFTDADFALLMFAWTKFDGPGAVEWSLSRKGPLRKRASEAAIEAMAFHNPSSARSLMDSLDVPELIDPLHNRMMKGWARSAFSDSFYQYAMNLQPSVERQIATETLVTVIASRGLDPLRDWLNAIPDDAPEKFKNLAFRKATNTLAFIDPAATAKWIMQFLGEEYGEALPMVVVRSWILLDDPGATTEWLVTLPVTDDRADKVQGNFRKWLASEPQEATGWLRDVAPLAGADPAIRWMVRTNVIKNPPAALDWAHLIHSDVARLNVLKAVSRAWYKRDPEAFEAWLPESGLEIELGNTLSSMRSSNSNDGESPNP
jgi:hypothetical protein